MASQKRASLGGERGSKREQRDPEVAAADAAFAAGLGDADDDGEQYDDAYDDEIEREEWEDDPEAVAAAAAAGAAAQAEDDDDDGRELLGRLTLEDEGDDSDEAPRQIWRPGVDQLEPGDELTYDSSAYQLMHPMTVEWPCLSFDIVPDMLGFQRTRPPHTVYLIAGTQAARPSDNKLLVLKASELHRTKNDDRSDSEGEEGGGGGGGGGEGGGEGGDDDLDDDPVIESRAMRHPCGTNRVRGMPQTAGVVATWGEDGRVRVWDAQPYLAALDAPGTAVAATTRPLATVAHATEGYAMDWSPVASGHLLTGDCDGGLQLSRAHQGGAGWAAPVAYTGHSASVEDVQWSPVQADVFASCGVDRTIRVWDARASAAPQLTVAAHATDVNVIAWNRLTTYLLVSGADDGCFRIWDLRAGFATGGAPVADFRWHRAAITSVEWSATENSVLVVAGADDQITLWDLSLEHDPEAGDQSVPDLPPQLLFQHQGQRDIKEVHWHRQIPGLLVSTAADGFNIWQPDV